MCGSLESGLHSSEQKHREDGAGCSPVPTPVAPAAAPSARRAGAVRTTSGTVEASPDRSDSLGFVPCPPSVPGHLAVTSPYAPPPCDSFLDFPRWFWGAWQVFCRTSLRWGLCDVPPGHSGAGEQGHEVGPASSHCLEGAHRPQDASRWRWPDHLAEVCCQGLSAKLSPPFRTVGGRLCAPALQGGARPSPVPGAGHLASCREPAPRPHLVTRSATCSRR